MREEDEDRLLRAVWPDGIPQRDRVILDGLLLDRRAEVVARLWTVGEEPGAGFRVSNVAFGLDAVYLTGDQGIWKLPLMLGRGMKHGEL